MKVKTKYYYTCDDKSYRCGGKLLLKDGKVLIKSDEQNKHLKNFYFGGVNMMINYSTERGKSLTKVNHIITESSYGKNQKEYLVNLTWIQKQKVLWMFGQQWLQQPGNGIQLLVIIILIATALTGIHYLPILN